jgi:hypothetical protein
MAVRLRWGRGQLTSFTTIKRSYCRSDASQLADGFWRVASAAVIVVFFAFQQGVTLAGRFKVSSSTALVAAFIVFGISERVRAVWLLKLCQGVANGTKSKFLYLVPRSMESNAAL